MDRVERMPNVVKMSRAMKYENLGSKSDPKYTIDHYPEKDCFIPEATAFANANVSQGKSWDHLFLGEMDRLLSKAGLRVL